MVGHYLGDPNNPLITIIDTPGTGDDQGRDCEHGIALAKGVKRIGKIDAFMVLLNGQKARFSEPLQEQMKMYQNIFGKEIWDNTIIEFTYWSHNGRDIRKRKKSRKLDVNKQTKFWNEVFAVKFRLDKTIPIVFVDPVFEEDFADKNEIAINKRNTDRLWRLLTKNNKPYTCGKRCQAPSGFFSGNPWLLEDGSSTDQRPGALAAVTWQIWFAGCNGNGTRSYTISHVDATNVTTVLFKSVFDNGTSTADDSNLLAGIEVKDETGEKFITIRLKIKSLEDKHFGSYFVVNDKGTSKPGQVNKIVDGEWQEWGPFGNCSKACITGRRHTQFLIPKM